jgi:hypothetical protein
MLIELYWLIRFSFNAHQDIATTLLIFAFLHAKLLHCKAVSWMNVIVKIILIVSHRIVILLHITVNLIVLAQSLKMLVFAQ